MACGDVLSLEDLQTAKKHQIFEAEVITGKVGGLATGADIATATNAATGQVQTTLPETLRQAGFKPASFTFVTGGTLNAGDYNLAVYNPAPNGDNNWYSWGGAMPKVIAPNSTPQTSGGFGATAWIPKTDNALRPSVREALRRTAEGDGFSLVAGSFEAGGTVTKITEALLQESTGKMYYWTGALPKTVAAGGTPDAGWLEAISLPANKSGHFGSDDRSGAIRTLHLVGDSHTYGEGSRGDFGPFLIGTHSTRYGATTWSTLLKKHLQESFGADATDFVPNMAESTGFKNKVTGIRPLYAYPAKVIDEVEFAHTDANLFYQPARFSAIEINRLNYNSVNGFYGKACLIAQYKANDSDKVEQGPTYVFTPSGLESYDNNGRFGTMLNVICIDGTSRTRPFVTFNKLPIGLAAGKVFYLRVKGGPSANTDLATPTQVVCEKILVLGGFNLVAFSLPNGTGYSFAQMQAIYGDIPTYKSTAEISGAIEPVIEVPIENPSSLFSFDIITGFCGVDVNVAMLPLDGGTNANKEKMIGDWYYFTSVHNGQAPTINVMSKQDNSTLVNTTTDIVKWIGTPANAIGGALVIEASRYFPNPIPSYSDLPFTLSFGVRVTGLVRFTPYAIKKYTNSPAGFHIAIRGASASNMAKICTHGFGCHSVGDWIGRTADICNHDGGVAFNHVPMMVKCEELNSKANRFVVVQAPMVNEYLRQTTIAQYKSDLTAFYTMMFDNAPTASSKDQFVIFTGAGENGHDPYLGPVVAAQAITYQMYRDATREWAEAAGVTYIDAAIVQRDLIQQGKAVATDFLMYSGSSYDSNHPNNYVHQLWFDEIKKVIPKVFQ